MIEPYSSISTSTTGTQVTTILSSLTYHNKAALTSSDDSSWVTVTTTTSNASTTGITTYLCNWDGHCLGATCRTDDDCGDTKPYGTSTCYQGHCVAAINIPDNDSTTSASTFTSSTISAISTSFSSSYSSASLLATNTYTPTSNTGMSLPTSSNSIQPSSSPSSSSNSIALSSILGIVGGILALLLTIILLVVLFFKIRRRRMINSLSEIPCVQRKKGDIYESYSGHNSYQNNDYQAMQEEECRRAELAAN